MDIYFTEKHQLENESLLDVKMQNGITSNREYKKVTLAELFDNESSENQIRGNSRIIPERDYEQYKFDSVETKGSKVAGLLRGLRREVRYIFNPMKEVFDEMYLKKDNATPSKKDRLAQIDESFQKARDYLDKNIPYIFSNELENDLQKEGQVSFEQFTKAYEQLVTGAKQCRIEAQWGSLDIRTKSEGDYKRFTEALLKLARAVQERLARSEKRLDNEGK